MNNEYKCKQLFDINYDAFPYFAGDTLRLCRYVQLSHSSDYINKGSKKVPIDIITTEHITKGIGTLKSHNIKNNNNSQKNMDKLQTEENLSKMLDVITQSK